MTIRTLDGKAVLVTGGAGFIGSHLVDRLLELGCTVRVLDDLSTGRRENLAHCIDRVEFIEGDIRDLDTCRVACSQIEVVFHQAALGSVSRSMKDPSTTLAVNVSGTANIFTSARDAGVRRVVYASSSSVYGDSEKLPKREGEEGRPLSPYALSKRMCEELADQFHRSFGTEVVGLRYFNVFGPRQSPEGPYAAVIPRFFAALLRDEAPVIYGDGAQSRDFTPVAEAVRANLLAASAELVDAGLVVNVATGHRTTIEDLAREIGRIVGNERSPEHDEPRPGDVRHSHADLARATARIGYASRTTLAEGLALCLDYYQKPATR
jgi:nucleoside-diphosphate-sugar epimerase